MACLRVTKLAFPVCLSLGLIGAANASSFTNGDFESPDIGNIFYNTYGNTSTMITGWTVDAPNGGNVAIIGAGAGPVYPPESGSQWIDLTGTGGLNQGLTQAFDTTSGHSYSVSFWVGSAQEDGSITSIVDATIDGLSAGLFQYTNLGSAVAWKEFTFSFTASAASTTLGFFNDNTIGSLNGLDNVTVTDQGAVSATPLPAALPLFASGLGAMGLFGWRRKRKNTAAIAAA